MTAKGGKEKWIPQDTDRCGFAERRNRAALIYTSIVLNDEM